MTGKDHEVGSEGSAARFDDLIHAPTRLSLVALLAAAEWAEFKYLRDALGLSDSALSKQLSTLEAAGYVRVRKGFVGKRPRTWARLSPAGRAAFTGHVAALQRILHSAGDGLITTHHPVAADDDPAALTDQRP